MVAIHSTPSVRRALSLSLITATILATLAVLPSLTLASSHPIQRSTSRHGLVAQLLKSRQPTGTFAQQYLASGYHNGSTAPGASPDDAGGQTVVVGGTGADDNSQVPACNTIFINVAEVGGSYNAGWNMTPNVLGFYQDRNLTYGANTMPVFIETKDFTKVKRVVITQPGKPRDAWKYADLFRNSLICAVSNSSMNVQLSDVLVVAPIWLAEEDAQAGAGKKTDLYYTSGGWSTGSKAKGPGNGDDAKSSFRVLDDLVKRFANQKEFPAVTSIMMAGHSLGGSTTQRYSMARNTDNTTDPLLRFWVGNPGAWVWPTSSRPVQPSDTSCASSINDWPYGVGGQLPAYADKKQTNETIIARYRTRQMQYNLGLLDDGPGDTHCEAQYQGDSHLNRGQNMQKALQGMPGGVPSTQAFNFVPNTSHQDYKMMADPNSQEWLYVTGLNDPRPAGTTGGSSSGSTSSSGSGSSSSSSKGSSAATQKSAAAASHGSPYGQGAVLSALAIATAGWALLMA